MATLPPGYVPPIGLANCLSSSRPGPSGGNGDSAPPTVSLLSSTSAALILPSQSLRTPAAVAHATAPNLTLHVTPSRVTLTSPSSPDITWRTPNVPHPASARDAACATVPSLGVVALVAGSAGVALYTAPAASAPLPPAFLPNSSSHSCVAVDISATPASTFIAAATIYGRLALWSLSGAAFSSTQAFDAPARAAVHDRVTQVLFSRNNTLAVAWWSGLVSLYTLTDRWSLSWTHACPPDPHSSFGTCPGTFVAFGPAVVAAATGHGVVHFLALDGGFTVSARRAVERRPKSAVTHVKGFCCGDGGVLVLARGNKALVSIAFPASDAVEKSVVAGLKQGDMEQLVSLKPPPFDRGNVTVRCREAAVEIVCSEAKRPRVVALPMGAKEIVLGRPGDDRKSGTLYASSIYATPQCFVVIVKHVVLACGVEVGASWTAAVAPWDVGVVAVAEGPAKDGEEWQEKPELKRSVLSVREDGSVGLRWDAETGQVLDSCEEPLSFPGVVASAVGCLTHSGYFACLVSGEDGSSVAFLPPASLFSGSLVLTAELLPAGDGELFLSGMWTAVTVSVLVLSRDGGEESMFVAVDLRGEEISVRAASSLTRGSRWPASFKTAHAVARRSMVQAAAAARKAEAAAAIGAGAPPGFS